MKVRRLGYALGAEISDIDLRDPFSESMIAELRQLWLEHILLCFRDQDLSPEQQMAFCSRFGELDDHRNRPHFNRPDYPKVSMIVNKPVTIAGKRLLSVSADLWHTDLSFTTRPSGGIFLLARQLPDIGGDTMFANMYLAYDTLSQTVKNTIEQLEGIHDIARASNFSRTAYGPARQANHPPVAHPVVRTHPETAQKFLYVGSFLRGFVGLSNEESRALVQLLNEHAVRPEFVYRHRWMPNDFLMWDNRCSLHYAVQDYDQSQSRVMQRCALLGQPLGRILEKDATAAS